MPHSVVGHSNSLSYDEAMDDVGSVVPKSEESGKVHHSFALRRVMWFGIGALGFGTIAFTISLTYIFRHDSQQRLVPVLIAILYEIGRAHV